MALSKMELTLFSISDSIKFATDKVVAFASSLNIADEYINDIKACTSDAVSNSMDGVSIVKIKAKLIGHLFTLEVLGSKRVVMKKRIKFQ